MGKRSNQDLGERGQLAREQRLKHAAGDEKVDGDGRPGPGSRLLVRAAEMLGRVFPG